MKNNRTKIYLIAGIATLFLTSLFLIIPITKIFVTAYISALIGIIGLSLGAIILDRDDVSLPQDFVFIVVAKNYILTNLIFSGVVLLIENIIWSLPILFFVLGHFGIICFFAIKVIALFAGKNQIETLGKKVDEKVFEINMMLADIDVLKERCSDDKELTREINLVYEAIRYADPMSNDRLEQYNDKIKDSIVNLESAVDENNSERIKEVCTTIKRQVKDRNNRVRAMK